MSDIGMIVAIVVGVIVVLVGAFSIFKMKGQDDYTTDGKVRTDHHRPHIRWERKDGYDIQIVNGFSMFHKDGIEVAILPVNSQKLRDHYNSRGIGTENAVYSPEHGTYNPWQADDGIDDEKVHSWFGGGGLSVLLLSFPVFLFDIAWWWVWNISLPKAGMYPSQDEKMFFFSLCIGAFQVIYGLATGGYGFVAIPASLLSFVVLVWVL